MSKMANFYGTAATICGMMQPNSMGSSDEIFMLQSIHNSAHDLDGPNWLHISNAYGG